MMVLRVSRGLLSLHLFAKVFLGPPIKGVAYQFHASFHPCELDLNNLIINN